MNIHEFCRKAYREFIEAQDIDPAFKKSLRTHERVPAFIDNLSREFSKLTFEPKRETLTLAVEDMCRLFINCVQRSYTDRIMSDLDKYTIRKEAEDKAQFVKEADALDAGGTDALIRLQKGEVEYSESTFDPGGPTGEAIGEN